MIWLGSAFFIGINLTLLWCSIRDAAGRAEMHYKCYGPYK